jgi:hypothetical protein
VFCNMKRSNHNSVTSTLSVPVLLLCNRNERILDNILQVDASRPSLHLGPQRHLHRVGQLVHAGQHRGAAVHAEADLLDGIAARGLQLRQRLRAFGRLKK